MNIHSGDLMERKKVGSTNQIVSQISIEYLQKRIFGIFILAVLLSASIMIFSNIGLPGSASRAPTQLEGLPDSGNYNYVTLADINKDGDLDIIAGAGGYPGREPGGLYVFLNNGDNSFSEASSGLPGPGSNYFGSVQVIDIDSDSNLDLIAAYESRWSGGESNGIGIWFGNGGDKNSLIWTQADSPAASGSFDSAFCADIDNDGHLDLVGGSSDGLYAWSGTHSEGALSWTEINDGLPSTNEYCGVTLGDVNNDGRLDIIAGSYDSRGISVYICNSFGSILWTDGHTDTNLKHTGNTFDHHLIDLNDDSKLDLISTIRGGIKVYLGNGNSGGRDSWWTEVSSGLPTSDDYYELAVDDVNADGKLDICANFQIWSNLGSMSDSGSYSWEQIDFGAELSEPVGTAIGDLNKDGYLDIVGCGWGSGIVAYTLSLGSSDLQKFELSGTVTHMETNEPINNVLISLEPGGKSTKTDEEGKYIFMLTNGSYIQTFSSSGYESKSINVEIMGNKVLKDIVLQPKKDEDPGFLPSMETPIIIFAFVLLIIMFKRYSISKRS